MFSILIHHRVRHIVSQLTTNCSNCFMSYVAIFSVEVALDGALGIHSSLPKVNPENINLRNLDLKFCRYIRVVVLKVFQKFRSKQKLFSSILNVKNTIC